MSAEAFAAQTSVSRETLERLERYVALLKKWNPAINIVSRSTLDEVWTRHMLDSAQILNLAPADSQTWVDLGSGGGFPGLVVAILAKEKAPDLRVTCVESDVRKATFLRTVARETGTEVTVHAQRIETVPPQNADVLSARALAPLSRLCEFANRHLKPDGFALFPKGESHAQEVKDALENWSFQTDTYPSKTNPNAVILKLGEIRRV